MRAQARRATIRAIHDLERTAPTPHPERFERAGDLLASAARLVRSGLGPLVLAVAPVVLVGQALLTLLTLSSPVRLTEEEGGGVSLDVSGSGYLLGLGTVVVLVAVGVLGQLACLRLLVGLRRGRPAEAGTGWRAAGALLPAALVLTLLTALGVTAGLALFALPGIYLAVTWSVALPVLALEGRAPTGALGRSAELVRGRWWATFGRLLAAALVAGALDLVATGLVGSLLSPVVEPGSPAGTVVGAGLGALCSLVTVPFLAAVVLLVHEDLVARVDGDLPARTREELAAVADRGEPITPAAPVEPTSPPAPPPGWAPPRPGG